MGKVTTDIFIVFAKICNYNLHIVHIFVLSLAKFKNPYRTSFDCIIPLRNIRKAAYIPQRTVLFKLSNNAIE